MKSRKKLAVAGCAAVLTLSTVVMLSLDNKEGSKRVTSDKSSRVKGVNKKEITFTPAQIQVVYEAIKDNKIEPFVAYMKEGGSLSEVVMVEEKEMTLAEAIVHHERLEFIKKAVSLAPELKEHAYVHEARDISAGVGSNHLASLSEAASSSLVPLIEAIANSAKPHLKKEILGLTKTDPEILAAVERAASEVLPNAVATCDQEQIRFLGDLGADPMAKNQDGKNGLDTAGKTKCFNALSYWKKEQNLDFDKKNEDGISGFDVLAKFKDPELQSFTDQLQDEEVREIASLKPKVKRVSFYKKRVPSAIIDPEALVEPELRPDEATETAEFSEFSD